MQYHAISQGRPVSDMKLDWHSNNEEVVKVGTNVGVATAVGGPGMADVWASARDIQSNHIRLQTTGQGGDGPKPRYPTVLFSEIDPDPDTGSPRRIDPDAGTVVQDVADRRKNLYWINMRSPIAERFHSREGGLTYQSAEFRVYLAERYAEVVFRDALDKADQWESADVVELLRDRPTRLRQAFAVNFQDWLLGRLAVQ